MNDTLSIKALAISTVGATQLPGSSLNFARVAAASAGSIRRNAALGSLNPTDIRVSHQPRSAKTEIQRSLFKIEQTLTRIDALSNPIGEVKFDIGIQSNIPKGVTLVEWRAGCALVMGALLANDGELLNSMFYGEE